MHCALLAAGLLLATCASAQTPAIAPTAPSTRASAPESTSTLVSRFREAARLSSPYSDLIGAPLTAEAIQARLDQHLMTLQGAQFDVTLFADGNSFAVGKYATDEDRASTTMIQVVEPAHSRRASPVSVITPAMLIDIINAQSLILRKIEDIEKRLPPPVIQKHQK